MRPITAEERRTRLAVRHRLAPSSRARLPLEVAESLVAIHSSDAVSVFLELRSRLAESNVAMIERGMYDEEHLIRAVGMRRTLFVVPAELAPVVHAAVTRDLAVSERKRLVGYLAGASLGGDEPATWLAEVEGQTLEALARLGEAAAAELSREVPQLRLQIPVGAGKKWQGTMGVSTRVLWLLAMEGRIVRTRPRGSWISSQYRWALADGRLPGGFGHLPAETARVEIVRRWLAAYGPGTMSDLRWWTGFTARTVGAAIAEVGAVEVDLDGSTGYALPDDLEPTPRSDPWVALLPALDSTPMGWAEREWYLGGHRALLFDSNGNVGPTVWADGRIVGGWAQRPDGAVAVRLLEDVGRETATAIEAEAEALQDWLGPTRFVARFRTPLERELTG